MKKRKNNKKIPSYAFGLNDSINIGGMLMDTTGSIISGNSDARSKGSVAGSTLKGLGTGAAMGASIGSVIPGIGTAIGGAVGAVGGAIGGLFTGRKRKEEAIEQANRQATIEKTRNGLNQSAIAESEYWDNMTPAYTFENGGIMPDLAYVDNNEILRDDYGNIIKVPNTKPGTDNHLIDATTLDSVLSDKIKRPGTNNTFAKEGKKLVNMTKPSKGKDIFAENTNKLNKINANKAYEKLLAEQEDVKAKKGIKPKVKGIPAYEDGKGMTVSDARSKMNRDTYAAYGDFFDEIGKGLNQFGNALLYSPRQIFSPLLNNENVTKAVSQARNTKLNRNNITTSNDGSSFVDWLKAPNATAIAQKNSPYRRNYVTGDVDRDYYVHPLNSNRNAEVDAITGETIPVEEPIYFGENPPIVTVTTAKPKKETPSTPKAKTTTTTQQTTTIQPYLQPINIKLPDSALPEIPVPEIKGPKGKLLDYYPTTRKTKTTKTTKPQSAPFQMPTLDLPEVPTPTLKGPEGRLLDYYPTTRKTREGVKLGEFPDLLPLTPVLYNFAQSLRDAEVDPLVTNPYAGAITSNMARRRMNIEPMRNANRRTRAISNYNLANMNANTGVNLAARTQAAANEYAANADLYAQKQNADNSYLAEYSQMLNNLGQQFVEANNLYNENNARNRARSRDFGSAAASQLGKWAQVNRQERNMYNRDRVLLPYLADYLKRGYTEDMVNRTLKI